MKFSNRKSELFLIGFVGALSLTKAAWSAPIECCAISRASGGAAIATAEPSDSVFSNPATINQVKNRYFFTSFLTEQMTIGLFDNSPGSMFPGGLSFAQYRKDENATFQADNTLSLSLGGRLANRLQFGLSFKNEQYLWDEQRHRALGADAGLLYIPFDNLGIGLVNYNFSQQIDEEIEVLVDGRTWGLGVNYYYNNFLKLKMDYRPIEDFRPEGAFVMTGFETQTDKFMAFRMGYSFLAKPSPQRSFESDRKYSAGVGFLGPRFHLNYAYQEEKPSNDSLHTIDLGIPF